MIKPRRLGESASRTSPDEQLPQEVAEIPIGVRRVASWSWRLIVVAAALALVVWGISKITTIVIPLIIAVLLAGLLTPLVKILTRYTFLGRGTSSGVVLVGLILVVIGMFTLAGRSLVTQFGDISDKAVGGFQQLMDWATTTFDFQPKLLSQATDEIVDKIQDNADTLVNGAVNTASSTASVVGNFATGLVIALFALFFMLSSGPTIWRWCVGLLPPQARVPAHEGFRRGWRALSAYMRTQILVAAVDATGISIGLVCLGLGRYAVPIWLIVFLFSFVPIIGAILSGAIAVLIVLVMNGWIAAIIMLAVVLGVQQIESNVLQPFLMGKAVQLHPLAVFLGVAAGTIIANIPGALFAIPLMAFVNATMLYLTGRDPAPELGADEAVDAALMAPPQPHSPHHQDKKSRTQARTSGTDQEPSGKDPEAPGTGSARVGRDEGTAASGH
jgi:predicted PurR-regulated permease PerM